MINTEFLICLREQIMRNNIFSKIVGNFGCSAYIQVFDIHTRMIAHHSHNERESAKGLLNR